MSGGHFQYQQYQIEDIADEIDEMIESNDDETLDQYGVRRGNGYPPEVIEKFKEAAHTLRQAAEMAQRLDWLVSGDDGEESFMRRWEKEVRHSWQNEKLSD
jgi:predicted Zn-dependent protease